MSADHNQNLSQILFLYFTFLPAQRGMFLSQGGSLSDRGVNDDPVYAKVAPPNVEKLNFATSDSPTHDAFSSCGSSDVVVFQRHFHFGCFLCCNICWETESNLFLHVVSKNHTLVTFVGQV